jgi:hypothetical protein
LIVPLGQRQAKGGIPANSVKTAVSQAQAVQRKLREYRIGEIVTPRSRLVQDPLQTSERLR